MLQSTALEKDPNLYRLLARKLSGEASPEEREYLNSLLAEDAENGFIAQSIEAAWPKFAHPQEGPASEEKLNDLLYTLKQDNEDKPSNGLWIKYRRQFVIAAALLPIVFIGIYLLTQKTIKENTQLPTVASKIATEAGNRKQLTLPDGTKVWLNAASALIVHKNFNNTTREVELKGEAYFDVAHNAQKPFIVHTSLIDIKVLGTKFDVKDYESEPNIEATLLHGAIEVMKRNEPGSAKVILNPNEKLVFAKKIIPVSTPSEKKLIPENFKINEPDITITSLKANKNLVDIPETAWMYNKLKFEEESFDHIALLMERWYNVNIHFTDSKIKTFRLSGTFVNETVHEALDILKILVPFEYQINGNNILISNPKKTTPLKSI